MKALRKEARAREDKVVREVLRSRDVVLATCVGAATHSLRDEEFDLIVIDEAAQASAVLCACQQRFYFILFGCRFGALFCLEQAVTPPPCCFAVSFFFFLFLFFFSVWRPFYLESSSVTVSTTGCFFACEGFLEENMAWPDQKLCPFPIFCFLLYTGVSAWV